MSAMWMNTETRSHCAAHARPAVPQRAAQLVVRCSAAWGSSPRCRRGAGSVQTRLHNALELQPFAAFPQRCARLATAASAYSPALGAEQRMSLDPLAETWAGEWQPGQLVNVQSPTQFDELLAKHSDRLVVLMCKAHSCRPCKMFTRRYMSIAQRFPEVVCADVFGDATPETRRMMMSLAIKVTPTFKLYRAGECVGVTTGINDKKLMRAMLDVLLPSELEQHAAEIADTAEIADEGGQ